MSIIDPFDVAKKMPYNYDGLPANPHAPLMSEWNETLKFVDVTSNPPRPLAVTRHATTEML